MKRRTAAFVAHIIHPFVEGLDVLRCLSVRNKHVKGPHEPRAEEFEMGYHSQLHAYALGIRLVGLFINFIESWLWECERGHLEAGTLIHKGVCFCVWPVSSFLRVSGTWSSWHWGTHTVAIECR